MSATTRFRVQHDGLLALATEISGCLNVSELTEDASKVMTLLSQLMGKLKVHLAMEDQSLYPSFLEQGDDDLKRMAQRFIGEMGGIAEAVESYSQTWASPSVIEKNAGEFVNQTKGIISALAERIEKENKELYPAFDKLNEA